MAHVATNAKPPQPPNSFRTEVPYPMEFEDPLSVTCPACGLVGKYAVSSLMALEASCGSCGESFRRVGEGMRKAFSEDAGFWGIILVALALEPDLEVEFNDDVLDPSRTPADLINLALRLRPTLDPVEMRSLVLRHLSTALKSQSDGQDLDRTWNELFRAPNM